MDAHASITDGEGCTEGSAIPPKGPPGVPVKYPVDPACERVRTRAAVLGAVETVRVAALLRVWGSDPPGGGRTRGELTPSADRRWATIHGPMAQGARRHP